MARALEHSPSGMDKSTMVQTEIVREISAVK
jgi:hypothetical protein